MKKKEIYTACPEKITLSSEDGTLDIRCFKGVRRTILSGHKTLMIHQGNHRGAIKADKDNQVTGGKDVIVYISWM